MNKKHVIEKLIQANTAEFLPKIIIDETDAGRAYPSFSDFIDGVTTANSYLVSTIKEACACDYFINNTLFIFTDNGEATLRALADLRTAFTLNINVISYEVAN